ncbi:MAG: hypothetical protein LBQ52_09850 [Helicobacteraceae bacterium]|jgi:hypothetical protein|nr:hypothetical protein [Helicobacteraceae bacterium]
MMTWQELSALMQNYLVTEGGFNLTAAAATKKFCDAISKAVDEFVQTNAPLLVAAQGGEA